MKTQNCRKRSSRFTAVAATIAVLFSTLLAVLSSTGGRDLPTPPRPVEPGEGERREEPRPRDPVQQAGTAAVANGEKKVAPKTEERSAGDLLAELKDRIARDGAAARSTHAVIMELYELARRSPAAVATVMDGLAGASCTDEEAAVLLSVVSAANTDAARRAFLGYLEASLTPDTRRELAVLYVEQVEEPGRDFEEALERLMLARGSLGQNALLALASVGDRLREKQHERFLGITGAIVQALNHARTPEETRIALLAVGNLGPDRLPGSVRSALDGGVAPVRAAAVEALLRIPGAEIDVILARVAREDPSEEVRLAASAVLEYRQERRRGA